MAKLTRQALLKQTAAGAATIGALAAVPGLITAHATALTEAGSAAEAPRRAMVAYVRDTTKEELTVLVGTREITVRDRALVRRLAKAAR